jgi:cytochrome c oxidase subunit II
MQTLGPKAAAMAPAADSSVHTASVGARIQGPQQAAHDTAAAAPTAPPDPAYAAGEKLFLTKGCVGCHSLTAVNAPKGMVGPNLANVGARTYIAAGTLKNTDENLAHWIRDPQGIKKGVLMPNLGVTADEARSLVAFLRAHQ